LGVVIAVAIVVTLATMLVTARLGYRPRWGALAALIASLLTASASGQRRATRSASSRDARWPTNL
jgi:hypothetical protein